MTTMTNINSRTKPIITAEKIAYQFYGRMLEPTAVLFLKRKSRAIQRRVIVLFKTATKFVKTLDGTWALDKAQSTTHSRVYSNGKFECLSTPDYLQFKSVADGRVLLSFKTFGDDHYTIGVRLDHIPKAVAHTPEPSGFVEYDSRNNQTRVQPIPIIGTVKHRVYGPFEYINDVPQYWLFGMNLTMEEWRTALFEPAHRIASRYNKTITTKS